MRAGLLWLSHWGWGLSIEFGQGVLKLSHFRKTNQPTPRIRFGLCDVGELRALRFGVAATGCAVCRCKNGCKAQRCLI